jgi:hypothetical protein
MTALALDLEAGADGSAPRTDNAGELDEEGDATKPRTPTGLALDYHTARKLTQALGAHLDALDHGRDRRGTRCRRAAGTGCGGLPR